MNKQEIRTRMKAERNKMPMHEVVRLSEIAAKRFVESDFYKTARTIMIYNPLGNETDTKYIADRIFSDGKTAVLPATDTKTDNIIPVKIEKNSEMIQGAYNIREPKYIMTVNKEEIDVVIVPGITFDKKGVRVGFGKGYYDRFLKDIKAKKIGFCYGYQIVDEITSDSFDINMDCLICEKELVICE